MDINNKELVSVNKDAKDSIKKVIIILFKINNVKQNMPYYVKEIIMDYECILRKSIKELNNELDGADTDSLNVRTQFVINKVNNMCNQCEYIIAQYKNELKEKSFFRKNNTLLFFNFFMCVILMGMVGTLIFYIC